MALPLPENNNNDNLLSYEDEDDEGSMSSGQGSNNSIGSKKSRPQRTKRQHFKKKGKKLGILNFHKTDIKGNQLHNIHQLLDKSKLLTFIMNFRT